MDDLRAGVYRHYKGPLYLVLGLAHDANADELYSNEYADGTEPVLKSSQPLGEREVVVYVGLQLDDAHTGARLAVRTLDDFFAWVHVDLSHDNYGTVCKNFAVQSRTGPWCHCRTDLALQDIAPRFAYVGARWDG